MASVAAVPGLPRDRASLAALAKTSAETGVPVDFLAAVISFETGKTWDPAISNPDSNCTGLIQFCYKARKRLGVTVAQLKMMSVAAQLALVTRYYKWLSPGALKAAGRNLDDAYLAVFAPSSIGRGPDHVIYRAPTKEYEQNKALDRDGDGTIRVREAVASVRSILAATKKRIELPPASAIRDGEGIAVFGAALLMLITAWFFHMRSRRVVPR